MTSCASPRRPCVSSSSTNAVESGSPLANSPEAIAHGGFAPPVEYKPDVLINNELGWKTEWMGRRLQWNGAIYKEEWKNAQIAIFDPGVTGNLTFSANGGTFEVKGLETSLVARVTPALTVSAGGSYNDSKLTKVAGFNWNDGTPIDFSQFTDANGNPLSTPGGDKGSPLSSSPKSRHWCDPAGAGRSHAGLIGVLDRTSPIVRPRRTRDS